MYKDIKVECYSADTISELEKQVNMWIEKYGKEIVDIKHSVAMCLDEKRIYETYTALIIYVNE